MGERSDLCGRLVSLKGRGRRSTEVFTSGYTHRHLLRRDLGVLEVQDGGLVRKERVGGVQLS